MMRIKVNRAKCGKCEEVIESKYRHDYVTCGCGSTSVDGGKDYLRRGYTPEFGYVEMSISEEENT